MSNWATSDAQVDCCVHVCALTEHGSEVVGSEEVVERASERREDEAEVAAHTEPSEQWVHSVRAGQAVLLHASRGLQLLQRLRRVDRRVAGGGQVLQDARLLLCGVPVARHVADDLDGHHILRLERNGDEA